MNPDVLRLEKSLLGHMGRYRVELDLANSPALQQFYEFRWAPIGNLGVDGLVQLLGPILGLETAVKLIIMSIPVLTVAGFLLVAREFQRNGMVMGEEKGAFVMAFSDITGRKTPNR